MNKYFPEVRSFGRRLKVELDLSYYAIKADLRNGTDIDTSAFDKNVDFTSLTLLSLGHFRPV